MAVTRLAIGKYQVDWRDSTGVRLRKRFPNKASAEQHAAQKKLIDISVGRTQQDANMRSMTVRELADRYMKEHLCYTRAGDNNCYVEMICAKWGDRKLNQLSVAQVRAWVLSLLKRPRSDTEGPLAVASVRKVLAYYKRLFNWGMEVEIVTQNPLSRLRLKKELKRINKRSVALDTTQYWQLLESLPDSPAYMKQVVTTAWCTGMRVGEILDLKWTDVNLESGLIRCSADRTKEADSKVIGIEPGLLEMLNGLRRASVCADNQYVFPSTNGQKVDHHNLNRAFRRCADKAGFTDVRIHDLRHSYTTRKRREGFDRSVIKAQTGHHTDSMFDWYNKVDETEIQAMAGFTDQSMTVLNEPLQALVREARSSGVSLGSVQYAVAATWRKAISIQDGHFLDTKAQRDLRVAS